MTIATTSWLKRQDCRSRSVKAVLSVIAENTHRNGLCHISQAAIAELSLYSVRLVRKVLCGLEKLGVISRVKRGLTKARGRDTDIIVLDIGRDFSFENEAPDRPPEDSDLPAQNDIHRAAVPRVREIQHARVGNHILRTDLFFETAKRIWRSRVAVDDTWLDLGYFPKRTEAALEIGRALAEIIISESAQRDWGARGNHSPALPFFID